MRVNVDSQALRDPRFRRAARRLNVSHHEVLARCISVWMVCYERREAVIAREDIEIAAELEGFTDALVGSDLADLVSDRDVYIRGVTERITFLERQSERGKKSGESRRQLSGELQKRTSVQQTFDLPLNERSISRSTGHRTNSPDQAHALDQDLKNTNDPGERERGATGSTTSPPQVSPETENVEPTPSGAASRALKPRKEPDPPPAEAFTLAHLLLHHVIGNHPESRIAKASERQREHTAGMWAVVIDRMSRLDGHSYPTIQKAIVWCSRHRYWSTVVLGADVLRAKWDRIIAEASRDNARPAARPGPTAQSLATLERLEAEEREKQQP